MKIAVLGYGTVGSGVVELVNMNNDSINNNASTDISIKYILDIRDFSDSPYANLFTKDFNDILNDNEVDVVVEVIGGLEPAYTFVSKSLMAGKSVVTSNKELVSVYGDKLLQMAKDNNVNFLFEASVGGGIPIIRPLNQCLTANKIESIAGILNGTTNFILTKMINEGQSFEDALKTAQKLGYAEADPSADIEGKDTCRKISILASLAFGKHVNPDTVATQGISKVSLEDMVRADKLGYTIKLLGMVKKADNDKFFINVAPYFVEKSNPLSTVQDVFNAILVDGNALGVSMFYGKGAGKLPTASAVVADVIDCAKHQKKRKDIFWESSNVNYACDINSMSCKHYARFSDSADTEELQKIFSDAQIFANENIIEVITAENTQNEFDAKLNAAFDSFGIKPVSTYKIFSI